MVMKSLNIYIVKKLEVDLHQEMSVAVWIHLVPGGCPPPFAMGLPWFRVTSLVQ